MLVYQGERWLWRRGGRSGSHLHLVEELELTRSEAAHAADRDPSFDDHVIHVDELLDQVRTSRIPAVTPPMAHRVANLHLPLTEAMACRGCRRDVQVMLDAELVFTID